MSIIREKETLVVIVSNQDGQKIIRFLKDRNLFDKKFKIKKSAKKLLIPVISLDNINSILADLNNIDYSLSLGKLEEREITGSSLLELLKNQIPADLYIFIPTSYDLIGDLVIIDIKDEMLQYSSIIAGSLKKLHPSIRSIYRKKSAIKGSHRIRQLELIYGDDNPNTIHKEYGLKISVNVKNIYFSPRLSTEHRRIAEQCRSQEYILDMFGATGVFALHIASLHDANIISVDINPHSERLLHQSMQINKKIIGKIIPMVGDIVDIASDLMISEKKFDRIIMNHPSNAISYLKLAYDLTVKHGIIYFYIFAPINDHEDYCYEKVRGLISDFSIINIHPVRQYSPDEYHSCITIRKN